MKQKGYVLGIVIVCLSAMFLGGCADTTLSDTVSSYVVINAPAQKIFEYMNDENKSSEWNPAMKETKNVDGEGVGRTYDWVYEVGGQNYTGKAVVTEWVPNRKEVIMSTGEIDSTWTFLWVPSGNQTKTIIVIEYSLEMPKAAKIAKEALAKQNQKGIDESLQNIKKKLEGG